MSQKIDEQNILKSIGDKIRQARKIKNLTQKQLAERLKCKQSFVCKLEKGKTQPGLFLLKNIETELKLKFFLANSTNIPTPDPPPVPVPAVETVGAE